MSEYCIEKLPRKIKDLMHLVSNLASCNRMRAYLVGGFVRDLILGVENFDLDIVVEGDGIKFAEDFAKATNGQLRMHRRFGTATVKTSGSLKVDIATARKESYPKPGSLPLVTPGTLKDDLGRRDFTINALAISISPDNFGKIIDFFSGIDDIRHKKIRVLHKISFIDDPTRILRAIRFEQRYNFRIERHTLRLLKEAVLNRALDEVSPHRLRGEIILILKEPHPVKYIRRTNHLVGLSFISLGLSYSKHLDSFLKSINKQISWFSRFASKKRTLDNWLIYFVGLISHLQTKQIIALSKKFGFSRGEIKRILSYKNTVNKNIKKLKRKIIPSQIYKILEPLSYEVVLLLKAKYKDRTLNKNIEDFLNIHNGTRIYTTGYDLTKLSVKPGPSYKKFLTQTLYAKLDGKINTREEELRFIKSLVKRSIS